MLQKAIPLGLSCACLLAIVLSVSANASPTLDTSFGNNGTASHLFPADDGGTSGGVANLNATRDKKLLAFGSYYVGRTAMGYPIYTTTMGLFGSEGILDTTFGTQGFINWPYPPLIQRDNKIVGVAPTSQPAGLARLNSDGTVETGFETNGAASLNWFSKFQVGAQIQQADGKIVLAGIINSPSGPVTNPPDRTGVVIRFNADGTLDLTFNHSGFVALPPVAQSLSTSPDGLVVQPDGKLVVGGTSQFPNLPLNAYYGVSVFRFNIDGTPDTSFNGSGQNTIVASDYLGQHTELHAAGLVIQPGGRLVTFGYDYRYHPVFGNSTSLLLGFTPAGQLDATFGSGGAVRGLLGDQKEASATVVQPDGKLLVVYYSGLSQTYEVVRLNFNGTPDLTFGNAGTLLSPTLYIGSLGLQADGDLVLGGKTVNQSPQYAFAIQRYISGPSAAIEYYNAPRDHYFITMDPQEVGDLDIGVYSGWARTGLSFLTYGSAASAASTSANPVCRFYIPPQHGDSHFFSADPAECAIVHDKINTDPNFSGYVEETPNAFYIDLPDKATGTCPANTTPVYRLWNQASASNHRYTTSVIVKNQMIAKGWVAEGYGPDAVDMCAPQS